MPPLDTPLAPSLDAGVNAAESTNANNLNKSLSAVIEALGDNSDAAITALNAIAAAITASIVGGTTGATANLALVSKGTTGRALQPALVYIDPSTGNTTAGASTNSGKKLTAVTAAASTDGIYAIASDNRYGLLIPSASSGAFNPAVVANDTALIYGDNDGIGDDKNLVVAPHNATASGFRMDVNGITRFSSEVGFPRVSLTDASTITWSGAFQQSAYVLLTSGVGATRALGAPSNLVSGFTYILVVQQSSTGSNALTYNAVYKWPGGIAPVLSTANNAIDILTFVSDGTNMYGAIQKAFA